MDENLEGVFIASVAFYRVIVEVAPFTEYVGCSFEATEFVGTGPADFIDCWFKDVKPDLPNVRIRKSRGKK